MLLATSNTTTFEATIIGLFILFHLVSHVKRILKYLKRIHSILGINMWFSKIHYKYSTLTTLCDHTTCPTTSQKVSVERQFLYLLFGSGFEIGSSVGSQKISDTTTSSSLSVIHFNIAIFYGKSWEVLGDSWDI